MCARATGAVGQKRKPSQPSSQNNRRGAKLQLQQDTPGLGQQQEQRGPSSNDMYFCRGASINWKVVHEKFEKGAPRQQLL